MSERHRPWRSRAADGQHEQRRSVAGEAATDSRHESIASVPSSDRSATVTSRAGDPVATGMPRRSTTNTSRSRGSRGAPRGWSRAARRPRRSRSARRRRRATRRAPARTDPGATTPRPSPSPADRARLPWPRCRARRSSPPGSPARPRGSRSRRRTRPPALRAAPSWSRSRARAASGATRRDRATWPPAPRAARGARKPRPARRARRRRERRHRAHAVLRSFMHHRRGTPRSRTDRSGWPPASRPRPPRRS